MKTSKHTIKYEDNNTGSYSSLGK